MVPAAAMDVRIGGERRTHDPLDFKIGIWHSAPNVTPHRDICVTWGGGGDLRFVSAAHVGREVIDRDQAIPLPGVRRRGYVAAGNTGHTAPTANRIVEEDLEAPVLAAAAVVKEADDGHVHVRRQTA